MHLEYLPNKGFILNTISINWQEKRNAVRETIGKTFKEDDTIIDVSHYFDGDESMNIHQRRDVYETLNSLKVLVFLNYDHDNKLKEIEVHAGLNVMIDDIKLQFGKDLSEQLNQFQNKGIVYTEIEEGNYLIAELKMTLANSESMGGDGNDLTYIYLSSDISHLSE